MKIITPPASPVIPMQIVRAQCKIMPSDEASEEDGLLLRALASGRALLQHETGRAIGEQTVEMALDAFPSGPIELPLGPFKSIVSVRYIDSSMVEQTMSPSAFVVDDYSYTPWLIPADGSVWPGAASIVNAVKIRYVCGDVPEEIAQALQLIVGHYHRHKQAVTDKQTYDLMLGVNALAGVHKIWTI